MDIEIAPHGMIVGPSGSGKTSSFRNLDRETTCIISPERKVLPFKGTFRKHFPLPMKLPKDVKDIPDRVVKETREVLEGAVEDKAVRLIIIDSFGKWVECLERQCRSMYTGWDIWNEYNAGIGAFLDRVKASATPIFLTSIDDLVVEQTVEEHISVRSRRVKIKGNQWEGSVEKEFSHVFFTANEKDGSGRLKYQLLTNSDGTCSAKTPMGMFEDLLIDNDLQFIIEEMGKYYGQPSAAAKPKKIVRR